MTRIDFVAWLKQRHDAIMACEQNGLELMAKGDIGAYRKKMREKAEALANLQRDARVAGLPQEDGEEIDAQLGRFSASAKTALELDSVFYMSALLYPDDYKKGEPDNLQIFINSLASA